MRSAFDVQIEETPLDTTLPALTRAAAEDLVEAADGIVEFSLAAGSVAAVLDETGGGGGNTAPSAVADTLTVAAGTAAQVDVVANDTDADGDSLSVTTYSDGAHGTVECTTTTCTYTAGGGAYSGPDTFTYSISDGHGGSATGTVAVTVTAPANRPPVAAADILTVGQGQSGTLDVLTNDSDPDGDPLHVTAQVSTPAHGSVQCQPSGSCAYTPAAGFAGDDSFTYTVADGNGGTDTATVSVVVTAPPPPDNRYPTATDDRLALDAGQASGTIDLLANDTDPDGDPLRSRACTAACTATPLPVRRGVHLHADCRVPRHRRVLLQHLRRPRRYRFGHRHPHRGRARERAARGRRRRGANQSQRGDQHRGDEQRQRPRRGP